MVKLIGLKKVKTAVFISGTGSNLKSLIKFSLLKNTNKDISRYKNLIKLYDKAEIIN